MSERAADVVVVGGGVVGCAVAWFLAREGVSVRLLERDDVARHASGAAAGMLLPFAESAGPGPFLTLARRSLDELPALCRELHQRSGVDPEFEACGALWVARSEASERRLREKARAFAAEGLEWLDAEAARDAVPGLPAELRGAVWSPREAHLQSPLLARAYAAAAAELGAKLERGVAASRVAIEGGRAVGVESSDGPRRAGAVVLCAGAWTPQVAPFALPVEPVRGQVLSLDDPRPPLRRILVAEDVYLVPKRDGRVVVGATEERAGFDCRVTGEGLTKLLDAGLRLLPALADCAFREAWAGLRPATPDGLPAVGPVPGLPGAFVAAGHFRNGVLLSPATGRLVAELVLGKTPPPEAHALRPERFGKAAG